MVTQEINTKGEFVWPPEPMQEVPNFLNTGVTIYEQMYGALANGPADNPYTRVSVANSSFSLDPVTGCPETCAYCVRLSNHRDAGAHLNGRGLHPDDVFGTNIIKLFDGDVLVDALAQHPAFIPNESVISVSTGSSEAFVRESGEESMKIVERVIALGLKNPIWFVTKSGISPANIEKWRGTFMAAKEAGVPIILSVTASDMPDLIEKNQRDRFKFLEELQDCGVYLSHHLRPIIRGFNDDPEQIRELLKRSLPLVKSVCIGGLRADPGIVIAWEKISALSLDMLPGKPGEKDLPEGLKEKVREIMDELGYSDIPLFEKSSHVLAHATDGYDYNLYEYIVPELEPGEILHVPINKLDEVDIGIPEFEEALKYAMERIGLDAVKLHADVYEGFVRVRAETDLDLSDYRIKREIIHSIGHLRLLPTNIYAQE